VPSACGAMNIEPAELRENTGNGMRWFSFAALESMPRLVQAVTCAPWNMAPHRGAGQERAVQYRRELCTALGLPFDRLTLPRQVHGAEVLRVQPGDAGAGRHGPEDALAFVDGLFTSEPDLPLMVLSADCPLVLVVEPELPAIGVAHASWRGTVAGIVEWLVRRMTVELEASPARMWAAVGPSAGPCCYEVGPIVRRIAATHWSDADGHFPVRGGRIYFDLWSAIRTQLARAGVPCSQILVAGRCTICDEAFYSHRRQGASAGRFALLAAVRSR